MLAVSVVKDLSLLTADVSVAFMDTSVEAEAGDYVASSEHVYQWMQSDCVAWKSHEWFFCPSPLRFGGSM